MVQFYCVDDEAWFDIKVTLKSGCFAGSSDEVSIAINTPHNIRYHSHCVCVCVCAVRCVGI